MSGTNTVELYNKTTNVTMTLKLYRVMTIGHIDRPNDDAKFKAVLRACKPLEQRQSPTSRTTFEEYTAIIPENLRTAVFEAFNNDCFILAEVCESCITTLVSMSDAHSFDVEEYKNKYREQPISAIDGSL